MKILVVEDEAPIRDLISINLQLVGYEVFTAEDGIMAEEFLEKQRVDLILLDVMIPGIDGFSLIEKIKKHNTPVIFVTAKESVLDRVKGLRLGADDYIIKPFETMELLARIEVVLRRYNKNDNHIKFKNIEVDTKQRIVKLNNKEIYLTVKEYELLILLLKNKNIALSREQILEKVWGFEYGGETRTVDILLFPTAKILSEENIDKIYDCDHIIVDEAQFLTPEQIDELWKINKKANVPITCFGLLTNFRGELFPGAKRLIELSDEKIELETNSLCTCGAPAKFNARKVDGVFTMKGDEIEIDGASSNVEYVPLCGACFYKKVYRKGKK